MSHSGSWRGRLGDLLERSRTKGFVTYDEINGLFGDAVVANEEIETVLGMFAAAGVLVVDSGDVPTEDVRSAGRSHKSSDEEESAPDPVEAYMRDIERLAPLPPEDEDILIRQLSEGLELISQAVMSTDEGKAHLSAAMATKRGAADDADKAGFGEGVFAADTAQAEGRRFRELSDAGVGISELEEAAGCIETAVDTLVAGRARIEDARKRLVEGHIRLVPYLARRYANRGVEYLDLVQEGNTGLVRAAKRFNPLKEQRFATYATWWIRQAMTRAINEQGRTVRIPQLLIKERKRLNRAREELRQELDREPTRTELASALEVDIERVNRLIDLTKSPVRLDHPSGDSDALPLSEVVDFGTQDWSTTPLFQLVKRELQEILSGLDPPEQEVMRLRFGLVDDEPCTLAEICKRLQMSKERVRRLEAKALLKLRHPDFRERLPKPP